MIARLVWHAGPARRNRGWKRHLRAIRARARGSREDLERWQHEAVREHLAWARAAVPFFRERAPATDDLAAFPILTRADLQQRFEDLRDATRPRETLRPDASGGSTGEPVQVFHDDAYWQFEFASEVFLHEWWGIRPWCRTAYLWGEDLTPEETSWKARLEERLLGSLTLNVFDVDEARLAAFAERLRRLQPVCVHGYVSALDLFAAHLARRGDPGFRPEVLRSAAETLDPARRERIEAGFGQKVLDTYGSRESASLAAQCREGGYHVLSHGKVIELVDDDGRPVPPETPGRVLVTDLSNRAFGLVRYENGDVASWAAERTCACGCPYPLLERIHGRTSDFISTPDGRRVHGEWFSHLLYGNAAVERFQVRQTVPERVEVLTQGRATAADMEPVLAKIRERLGPVVEVRWQAVDEIPRTRTGKYRFTVSEVPYLSGAK